MQAWRPSRFLPVPNFVLSASRGMAQVEVQNETLLVVLDGLVTVFDEVYDELILELREHPP